MYPAPVVSISGAPGIDIETIADHLLLILQSSSVRAPLLAKNNHQPTSIEDASFVNRIVLFTHHQTTECISIDAVNEFQTIAKKTARTFIPIALTASTAGSDSERTSGAKEEEEEEEEEEDVATKPRVLTYGLEKELVLDVSQMSPEEIAGKIARWVWWVGEFMSWDDDE
ncbi:hypothetical protein P280DRAFT_506829 [Massarina eburnea CBS 473.64]|uniref:Uncharacterized protein n=1 Tax=Massarina eburnea CBS 473.64 TaxID=1395130 RepID=A0A6A6S262_9PLEO|nr:hypothetical protein P280DRAFT_506829 [Massarina eburnea CBS 473.64]